MNKGISSYNPFVCFLYFAVVICFSMFFLNPVFLCISILNSTILLCMLKGLKALKRTLFVVIPFVFISAFFNIFFNHEGMTILLYFNNGNPLTAESFLYGISTGLMLASVTLWFSCSNIFMTSDKLMYIFGKIIPSLSLLLSMIFRFVPKFCKEIKLIYKNRCSFYITLKNEKKSIKAKIKEGLTSVSVLVGTAFEGSINTADSMKARGFGLENRTSYSLFKFEKRDFAFIFALILLTFFVIYGIFNNYVYIKFFPLFKHPQLTLKSSFIYLLYTIICAIPIFIQGGEQIKWKFMR